MSFSRLQWLVWALGLVSSAMVMFAIVLTKEGPSWFWPVFFGAAAYCALAQAAIPIVRRGEFHARGQRWEAALSTSRLGLLVLIAIAAVLGAAYLFRLWV
jgi:hypothetical protein